MEVHTKRPASLPKATRTYLAKVERIQAAAEATVRARMRREVALDFAFALAGTTLLSLLAGWLVAGRALRPVSRITATARRVAAEGDLVGAIAGLLPALRAARMSPTEALRTI